ncbi:hypothetical protein CBW16_08410 [Flavobacteriaceae bacterium JJC]|nr:hypothetical protein CBW16_08410 [Flavobacteriaceae bacterium JJC]
MQLTLKKGSLQRNVFFMMLGNGVFAFAQWLQISLISKYSSIDTLGYFTLSLSIISPVFMLTGLQIRTLIVTDSDSKIDFNTFFKVRLFTSAVSLIVVLIIGFFLSNTSLYPFLLLLSVQKILEGISELFNSKQQQQEKVEILAQSLFLKGLSIILSVWMGLVFFKSLYIGLIFILIFFFLIIWLNDYRNYKNEYQRKVDFSAPFLDAKRLIISGLPLGLVLLILSLNANVSKYFLEAFCGTEKQAIYSSLSYILVLGLFILDSLGQTFVPRLSKYYYNEELVYFRKYAFIFLILSILVGVSLFILSLFFGEIALKFLFNSKIGEYSHFLSLYLLVSVLVFVASSLGYTLTAMGEFKIQPYINITVLVVNVLLSFLLIKDYELKGVLIVLGVCFTIQILITSFIILNRLNAKKNKKVS